VSIYAQAPSSTQPPPAEAGRPHEREGRPGATLTALALAALPVALTAGVLCMATFVATGGLSLETRVPMEIALTLISSLAAAAAILCAPRGSRLCGMWPTSLLFCLAALTAISLSWSVAPDTSWQEAGLLFSYGAAFGATALLVRASPASWRGVLLGIVLAAVIVCGYALLTKVLPAQLDRGEVPARLRAPYGYWNATGLTAAMGIIACLWLGTRRVGHALLSALGYPVMGLLMVTLMLAYSRGALAVALIGVAIWLLIVPHRLRGAGMLIVCAAGAAVVVGFDFANHALSSEAVVLSERVSAGRQLGVLVIALILALTLMGVAIGFRASSRPLSGQTRSRLGIALIALLVLVLLAGVGALAHTHRGFTGTISHDLSTVTNPNATVANTPGRLTAVASARARYWKQAIEVFEAHPVLGAGGGGYAIARKHYETGTQVVTQAHGFVVETLADLGVVGLALTLVLLGAWMYAAGRASHPFNRRWRKWRWQAIGMPYTPERVGLLSMLCIVVTFGMHSLVDWTWYVPGDALVALICAGWLAGRGPIEQSSIAVVTPWRHLIPPRLTPLRAALAAGTILAALLIAWSQWQPLRSVEASEEAFARLPNGSAALAAAHTAISRDPLSLDAMFTLASIQERLGESEQARATLLKAVRRQPANPRAWTELGLHDLPISPRTALGELRAAYYLEPSATSQSNYLNALNAVAALKTAPGSRSRAGGSESRARR
jgi:O-Antigen ligase